MPENEQDLQNLPQTEPEPATLPPETPQLSEEEMRKDIEGRFNEVQQRYQNTQQKNGDQQQRLEELKQQIFQYIFTALGDLGVDPNDLSSIQEFLQKLGAQDPDLLALFELVFSLMGQEAIPEAGPEGIAHKMPDGSTMPGPEHPGAVPGSEFRPPEPSLPEQEPNNL